jgi:hypothetical protein
VETIAVGGAVRRLLAGEAGVIVPVAALGRRISKKSVA